MNDFTKEELEDILHIITWHSGSRRNKESIRKLKLAIDRYCEENKSCEHDWGVGFGSIHSPVTYCKKCYCQKPELPNDIFIKVMGINNE